jgi:hypothetical protein
MPRVLFVGIALGGLIAGFMIGASSSPVVAAVIPALLSGIVSALALIFKSPSTEPQSRNLPNILGLILIAFFAPYSLGLGCGILVKTHEWLVVKPTVPSNLANLTKSADNLEGALLRIDIYRALQIQGFSNDLAGQVAGLKPSGGSSVANIRILLADLSPNVRSSETAPAADLPSKPLFVPK